MDVIIMISEFSPIQDFLFFFFFYRPLVYGIMTAWRRWLLRKCRRISWSWCRMWMVFTRSHRARKALVLFRPTTPIRVFSLGFRQRSARAEWAPRYVWFIFPGITLKGNQSRIQPKHPPLKIAAIVGRKMADTYKKWSKFISFDTSRNVFLLWVRLQDK